MLRGIYPLVCAGLLLTSATARAEPQTVSVLYAGSLVNLMEHGIGPAFSEATGISFQGVAGGSIGIANQIRGQLRRGDIFISANPKVNDNLTGGTNGAWENWYVNFAESPVVIGYNPSSRFAADLTSRPWYEVLQELGIKIGRTDPELDPKGVLTVRLLDQAEQAQKRLESPKRFSALRIILSRCGRRKVWSEVFNQVRSTLDFSMQPNGRSKNSRNSAAAGGRTQC